MKVVLQDGFKDCGVCSLLFIIRYYGGDVSKEYLREITNTTKDGVTLFNLVEAAKKIGFDACGLSGNLNDISINNLPCIAHINIKRNYKHFVVLYKIDYKNELVTLMDPAKGWRTVSYSEFNLLSSNNYLFLIPKKKLPILVRNKIIFNKIIHVAKKNKIIVFNILLLTLVYFVIVLLTSFHFKYVLEYSINVNISYNVFLISLIVGCLYFFKNTTNYFRNILLNKWNSIFNYEISTFTYNNLLLLPYLYYKNRTIGEVLSRFKDLNVIIEFLTNVYTSLSIDLITCIIFFIFMFNYNKSLTLMITFILFITTLLLLIIFKIKKKYIKNVKRGEDVINSYIVQGISNVDTIKGSHLEKRLIDKFNINYKALQDGIYKYLNIVEIENYIRTSSNDLINLILFGIGSYFVINNKIKLTTLILFQSFINYYTSSFSNVFNLVGSYSNYKISLDRLEEIFMIDLENFRNNYFYLSYTLDGDIIIDNLNYRINSKKIFNNLNLEIKRGSRILLCGESGSGKSTLMKMLLRYIEVEYGHIKIANIDINHYHLQNIRTNITYVSANEFLFNDTIKNNIALYKEYKEEEINEVIKICLVDEIIGNNELGVDTMIEENGFNLSNGERQRIILARSLIKKSNIYIFDEALGQIDTNKEKKILDNIFKYLKDKTIIVISHRFNNKKLFDRVIKLENGILIDK